MMKYYKIQEDGDHYIVHANTGRQVLYNGGKLSDEMICDMENGDLEELWDNYYTMSRTQRKKIPSKEMYTASTQAFRIELAPYIQPSAVMLTRWHTDDLFGTLGCPKEETKEEEMNTSIEQQTLDYLLRRLENAYYQKDAALPKVYGFRDDDPPTDHKELAERLEAGLYVIDEKHEGHYWSAYEAFHWRDPSVKKDTDGLEAAQDAVRAARQRTKDLIMVKTADEGLEALQAFEKEEFGPKSKKAKN